MSRRDWAFQQSPVRTDPRTVAKRVTTLWTVIPFTTFDIPHPVVATVLEIHGSLPS